MQISAMLRWALSILGFGVVYFVAAAVPIVLTRFEGGVAVVWVATALLTARLLTVPVERRPALCLMALISGICATGMFGLGWRVALPLAAVNVGEALLAATIMHRLETRHGATAWSFARFLIVSCVLCPALSAGPGAWLVDAASHTGFLSNVKGWFLGRSLGMLIFAPVSVHLLSGDIGKWFGSAFQRRDLGDFALLGLAIFMMIGTFSQNSYPLLFLPVLALVGFTLRAGYVGASIGNMLLACIGGYFTMKGWGPIALLHGSPAAATQFMQLYLGATALTMLPVATILLEQKRASVLLTDSEERYRMLADNVTDIVITMDLNGMVTYVSPSIRQYGGYSAEELIGQSALILIDPGFHDIVRETHVRMVKAQTTPVVVEYVGMTRDGKCRWFETIGRSLRDDSGMVIGVVGTVRETTGRRHLENELSIAAQSDVLTGLPNRRAFFDVARNFEALNETGCLALIDLDHFKRVNDSHGHAAGDKVLRLFAQIGEEAIRSTDMLARLGGEEFALILPGASIAQAQAICQRILDDLAHATMMQGGVKFHVTASAGIALFAGTIDDVLQKADTALYQAKGQGRARLALAA